MTMNWRELNTALPAMCEDTVYELLCKELCGACRKTVVIRLHQRFTALRASRERDELLAQINVAPPAP